MGVVYRVLTLMTDHPTRTQIVAFALFALLAAWMVFDARTAPARYLSAATFALLMYATMSRILRYRAR